MNEQLDKFIMRSDWDQALSPRVKTLNMDPLFDPLPNHERIGHVEYINYPSGCEPHARVHLAKYADVDLDTVVVTTRIRNAEQLLHVPLVLNSLQDQLRGKYTLVLFIPYLPHARQDRRAVPQDALSKEVVLKTLLTDRSRLVVFDLHSEQCGPQPVRSVPPNALWHRAMHAELQHNELDDMLLVLPDQGATNRLLPEIGARGYSDPPTWPQNHGSYELIGLLMRLPMLVCEKHRDPTDGKIQSQVPDREVSGKTCLIFDDICDGGATFTVIAKALKQRGAKRVVLVVSHGLFTKGLDPLLAAGIDHIYTTNSFRDMDATEHFTQFRDWSFANLLTA